MRHESEAALAAKVVAWLTDLGWDVYQEVEVAGRGRADIVAVQGPLLWAVETKNALSLDLLAQAARWLGCASYVSAAYPPTRRSYDCREFAERVAAERGIGMISVGSDEPFEAVRPRLNRRSADNIRRRLDPEQRTYAVAGNADSRFWSPFKRTCRDVASAVANEPGITIRALLERQKTHYASVGSARACLLRWIEAGKVPGVELRRDGGAVRLYPAARKAA